MRLPDGVTYILLRLICPSGVNARTKSQDLKRGISADVHLRPRCEYTYIKTNTTGGNEMTSTVQRSDNLNLEQIINQAFNFEEALHSALEEVGERFGLYDIINGSA
jgi:hypothetical protein